MSRSVRFNGRPTEANVEACKLLIKKYRELSEQWLRAAGSIRAITGLGSIDDCPLCAACDEEAVMMLHQKKIYCYQCIHETPRRKKITGEHYASPHHYAACLVDSSYSDLSSANMYFGHGNTSPDTVIRFAKKRADYLEKLLRKWELWQLKHKK